MQVQKIAFIGLGVMGYPMAGHLATAGHPVTVYNRTFARARDWCSDNLGGLAATLQRLRRIVQSFLLRGQ